MVVEATRNPPALGDLFIDTFEDRERLFPLPQILVTVTEKVQGFVDEISVAALRDEAEEAVLRRAQTIELALAFGTVVDGFDTLLGIRVLIEDPLEEIFTLTALKDWAIGARSGSTTTSQQKTWTQRH